MLTPKASRQMSFHARKSLREAAEIAARAGSHLVEPKHLLLALSLERGSLAGLLLKHMGIEQSALEAACLAPAAGKRESEAPAAEGTPPAKRTLAVSGFLPPLSPTLKTIVTRAYSIASKYRYPYVGSEHLVYALVESDDREVRSILDAQKADRQKIDSMIKMNMGFSGLPQLSQLFDLPDVTLTKKTEAEESRTPFLDQYGMDLNWETGESRDTFIARDRELERMIHILGRKQKNNPLLIGEPGVGKTTLVRSLARLINQGAAGPKLSGRRIVALDLALVVAGTNFRGEFESRLKEIVREAVEHPEVILFIDELHTIVGAGNTSGGLDAANILKPALARGELSCIGATTLTEYKRHIEKDPALERRFQPVLVSEPSPEETRHYLSECRADYEDFHHVTLTDEAIQAAVDLSVRFLPDRFLPDKAFDLVDEAASAAEARYAAGSSLAADIERLVQERHQVTLRKEDEVVAEHYDEAARLKGEEEHLSRRIQDFRDALERHLDQERPAITREDVAETVSRITRIPADKLLARPTDTLSRLHALLERRVVGQREAITPLVETLTRSWSGLGREHRPLGSFLFLGPSGTGKTLTAKTLAETLFGDRRALIQLNMSEFMERHSTAQLIGAPAGYIGYGEGGRLTEKVRRQPHSVVLFDEIEKAHPDVFNLLLQILDEGVLADADGRAVSFRNTVVILTSNLGAEEFARDARLGFAGGEKPGRGHAWETAKAAVLKKLKEEFRPELLNRLDHISVFAPLTLAHFEKIARLELDQLKKRLAERSIALAWDRSVSRQVAETALRAKEGARAVAKTIQTGIETGLAPHLFARTSGTLAIRHEAGTGGFTVLPIDTAPTTAKKARVKKSSARPEQKKAKKSVTSKPKPKTKKKKTW